MPGGRYRPPLLIGIPMYSNAAGIIPVVEALLGKGAALGHHARLHDERDRAVASRNDHSAQGAHVRLIAVFVGVVGTGILAVGFLFNILFLDPKDNHETN